MPAMPLAEFGRYTLIFVVATQIIFLNKSFVLNPMIKFAAEPGRFASVTKSGLMAGGALQLLLGGLLATAAPIAARILRLEPSDIMLAAALPMTFWIRDWGFCIQQTLYRTRRLFFIELIYYAGAAVGYVLLWRSGSASAVDVLRVNFAAAGASSLLTLALWPRGVTNGATVIRGVARQMFGYGLYTVGLGVSASLLAGADLMILGAIYTPEVVGLYGGAKRIYAVVSALISSAVLLVIPYASKLAAEERSAEARELFEKSTVYMAAGLTAVVAVGWLLAGPFYRLMMPPAYGASAPLFRLLLLAAPFEGLFNVTGSILYGLGAAATAAVTSGVGLVVLALALPMGAYFFGTTGAAVAQVLATAFTGILMTIGAARATRATVGSTLDRLWRGIGGVLRALIRR